MRTIASRSIAEDSSSFRRDPYAWLYRPQGRRLALRGAVAGAAVLAVAGVTAAALTPGPAARPAAPAAYSVRLAPVMQDYTDGCVPAVSSMLLSAFGIRAGQYALGVKMSTYVNHGTTGGDATRVLDAYLAPRRLDVVSVTGLTAGQLAAAFRASLAAGRPVMLSVWAKRLPWRRTDTVWYVHELLVTGIRGSTVAVFDPEIPSLRGGFHDLPVAVLSRAVIGAGVVERI